ncbi:hypothetical protein Clacol_009919 [Clathrus columnatus]|uniref:non-specific serine/threonine protein kinase n=1 Tax=Clathrus columnatus TaxID=1419009 RepID=A0AAV5AS84_9AGAM|nr:hypothetical protein Clacol_009919 [Clathrus columnatus]
MSAKNQLDTGSNGLANYQLGDSLGKGAFGQVYRALNWTTGETVAVKQIQLSNIPKGELGEIMHANIVKYKGFVKTREYLYIILEYCENGSLHNICKRFGKFPENLVAVYISQVLEGLVYLHEQGVIHRDIKGANILTNKDGSVKLADFGVASTTAAGASDAAVVGSPYWMAPEVIEQSGATTASDIWSVGCVVIELLEGKPPYHFLDPMPALFRIVQDDSPPIPEGASPKDCNLRISAKKLLRHPWMASARKQLSKGDIKSGVERSHANPNFDEAVLRVQEWNEALKCMAFFYHFLNLLISCLEAPTRNVPLKSIPPTNVNRSNDPRFMSPTPTPIDLASVTSSGGHYAPGRKVVSGNKPPIMAPFLTEKIQPLVLASPEEQTDNWDDDFEDGISLSKLQALDKPEPEKLDDNAQTIRPTRSPSSSGNVSLIRPPSAHIAPILEDYSDIGEELEEKVADFKMKNSFKRGLFHPNDLKTIGLGPIESSPFSMSPLEIPKNNRKASPPTMHTMSHSRASSLSGSIGRSDARRALSGSSDLERYTEAEDEDYEDVFAKPNGSGKEIGFTQRVDNDVLLVLEQPETLQLTTRLSNKSWLGDEMSDEEDPFAEIDEGFAEDDLETNLVRDKHARLCATVNRLVEELVPSSPDYALRDACDQLLGIIIEAPEMQSQMVSSHGLLAILEVLESKPSRDVVLKLMQIVNLLVISDIGILESFCLIGGIPVLMGFTSKKYSSECRLEASNFIRLLCHSSVLTLQMFISCRGLRVLVDLLDEDYADQSELIQHALNGIGSVFDLHSPTPKNDFCRMFIREGLLDPLSTALLNVMSSKKDSADDMKMKIIQILVVFCQVSQQDFHVRSALGTRKIVRRLLRACESLEPEYLVLMLKAVKHLSMSVTLLDVLQNANALEILVKVLEEQSSGPHSTEILNHIFQTCFNLCRLNKSRQEEAAQAGIIPCLKRVIETSSPLKQFALPILCDLASAGKSCRMLLWQHDGLSMYLKLLDDPYFQVSALEAILAWLQDETARVEDVLIQPEPSQALLKAFVTAKANSFENLLDPFLKICRISSTITIRIAKAEFFRRIIDRLTHSKAVVRLNLLRILRSACDVHPDRASLVEYYGIYEIVEKLSRQDGAVLVRELAREIIPVVAPQGLKAAATPKSVVAPKKRVRRTASDVGIGSDLPIPVSISKAKVRPARQKLGDIPWQQADTSGTTTRIPRR